MTNDQVSTILNALFELKKELGANSQETKDISKKVQRLEDTLVTIDSKINGKFEAHHQWVEERLKDVQGFAEREINLLKKEKAEVTTARIGAKSTIGVALIGAISGLIALFK